ncbi:MAG TPA: DNA-directed RNA polymerase subunit alpha [Chloroflexi bacterium]|nr:DNA-directed RNA polymerase subunit alpha [Chloroflexota bacterium]
MSVQVLPKIETDAISQTYGRFVIGPLESGFGVTLGNSLRRVLLSTLPGAAVTSIRLTEVPHEFMAIPGVREDVIQIVLQIKQLRLRMEGEEPMRMTLQVRNEGMVTAGDIQAPPEIEILNPDLYLFDVDSQEVDFDVEFQVEQGRGYLSSDGRGRLPMGELPIDATFSPIRRVTFDVGPARVGQVTDYDRLTMEIWTDGRIAPLDGLKEAARILVTHLRLIAGLTLEEEDEDFEEEVSPSLPSEVYEVPLEKLDLGVRVFNSLRRSGITSVGEVLEMLMLGEDTLLAIRNFGQKSLEELQAHLQEQGFWKEGAEKGGGE